MTAILEIENLCKTYPKAPRPALDNVTFQVDEGALYAFVGPNGAGKTTTIRIIATLLAFDAGAVRVAGHPVDAAPKAVRHVVGYIPDTFGLYEEMTVSEYLEFFAGCFDVPSSLRRPMIADLLDLVGLTHRADDDVQTLSRGMRQRLGIARALVHDPLLIVADEPAAGLDPRARVELREILKALQEMGKTIFLSSHVLRELDEIATHVGILEDGQLIATGAVDAIRTRLRPHRRVRIAFAGKHEDAHAWLARHPDVIDIAPLALSRNGGQENRSEQSFDLCVTLRGQTEIVVALLAALVAAGFPVRGYIEEQDSLESLFLNLTRGVVS